MFSIWYLWMHHSNYHLSVKVFTWWTEHIMHHMFQWRKYMIKAQDDSHVVKGTVDTPFVWQVRIWKASILFLMNLIISVPKPCRESRITYFLLLTEFKFLEYKQDEISNWYLWMYAFYSHLFLSFQLMEINRVYPPSLDKIFGKSSGCFTLVKPQGPFCMVHINLCSD